MKLMKLSGISGYVLFVGLALGLAATQLPQNAEASTSHLKDGQRYYDFEAQDWRVFKKKPRRAGRSGYVSNRSPIRKRRVRYRTKHAPGTIVVDTSERRLYYVLGKNRAIRYGIGVGRAGFTWNGTHKVTRKAEWPGWTPPKRMIARVKRQTGKTLKSYYPGGPNNPLGARALYIGSTIYRIHGTNQPWTIGQAMSSGCIRLANDDVEDLYSRVKIGSRIIVQH